jgi:hypothetical protein
MQLRGGRRQQLPAVLLAAIRVGAAAVGAGAVGAGAVGALAVGRLWSFPISNHPPYNPAEVRWI